MILNYTSKKRLHQSKKIIEYLLHPTKAEHFKFNTRESNFELPVILYSASKKAEFASGLRSDIGSGSI